MIVEKHCRQRRSRLALGPGRRRTGRCDGNAGVHHELRAQAKGKVENLGTQNIEGVMAEGTRTTTTIPADRSAMSATSISCPSWYSAELQMVVMTKRNDRARASQPCSPTSPRRAAALLFVFPAITTLPSRACDVARKVVVKDDQE